MKEHIPHALISKWQAALIKVQPLAEESTKTDQQRRAIISTLCQVESGDLFSPLVGSIEINEESGTAFIHIHGEKGLYSLSYHEASSKWRERGLWNTPRIEWGGQAEESTDAALSVIIKSFPAAVKDWAEFIKQEKCS